jgi:hypothetical protein
MVARMEPRLLSVGAKTVQLPPLRESWLTAVRLIASTNRWKSESDALCVSSSRVGAAFVNAAE